VSAQVRRLERALGLPLLHRVGRNVRLTDVGRAVRHLAVDVLEQAAAIEDLAAGYRQEDHGEVSVVAGPVIGAHRISNWLGPFVRAHPHVDVRISIAAMQPATEALSSGRVDVAILGNASAAPNFETISLERTELVVVVAAQHPLAGIRNPLTKLSAYRCLAHEHGSATQVHATRVLGDLGDLSPTIELEEGALVAALHTGLGYAVMPRAIIETDIAEGRLVVLPRPGRPVPVVFTAMRRPGPHTPVVQTFWEHLGALGTT
jgi:DNA-binding transcriptional LysR family regulator